MDMNIEFEIYALTHATMDPIWSRCFVVVK